MAKNLTLKEWFKTPQGKKNKIQLIIQEIFLLGILLALVFEHEGMSGEWLVISTTFITSIMWLCYIRVYRIYTNLLYTDWFNK